MEESLCGDHVLNFVLPFSFQLQKGGGGGRRAREGEKEKNWGGWGGDKKEDSSKTRLSFPLEFTCNGVNLNNILALSHLNYT